MWHAYFIQAFARLISKRHSRRRTAMQQSSVCCKIRRMKATLPNCRFLSCKHNAKAQDIGRRPGRKKKPSKQLKQKAPNRLKSPGIAHIFQGLSPLPSPPRGLQRTKQPHNHQRLTAKLNTQQTSEISNIGLGGSRT